MKIKYEYELSPRNGRKSFYGKAQVLEAEDGTKYLKSYETIMASVTPAGEVRRHCRDCSRTTNCHVKSFLETFSGMSPADFRSLPVVDYGRLVVEI